MIQYEIINGVGKITLNRPDKYHSFVREMALQLQGTLDKCNENKAVRAILITATGKAFCAGQDLGEVTDPNGPELTQIVQEHYNPIIRKIRNIEKPIVAAVNGVAAGAGGTHGDASSRRRRNSVRCVPPPAPAPPSVRCHGRL